MNFPYRPFSLIIMLCLGLLSNLHAAMPEQPVADVQAVQESEITDHIPGRYLKFVFCLCLAEALYLSANDQTQQGINSQLSFPSLSKNFLREYSSRAAVNFSHELGHALAAKIAGYQNIRVNLGSNSSGQVQKKLLTLFGVSLGGLDPNQGLTEWDAPETKETSAAIERMFLRDIVAYAKKHAMNVKDVTAEQQKEILAKTLESDEVTALLMIEAKKNRGKNAYVMLAGGTFGLLAHFCIKFAYHAIAQACDAARRAEGAGSILASACQEAINLDSIAVQQLFNMLMPYKTESGGRSDGAVFWEDCVGVSPAVTGVASEMAPYLERVAEMALAFKESKNPDAEFHSKMLMGLLNHELRGYLRFHC